MRYTEIKRIFAVISVVLMIVTATACSSTEELVPDSIDDEVEVAVTDTSTVHVHSFSEATCIIPATCSCGETEGTVTDHDWQEANCVSPKRCLMCASSEGDPLGHDYVNGSCSVCGATEQEDVMVWIPTMGGNKYHFDPECSDMNGPIYVTMEEAEEQGFTPCKRCFDF